SSFFSGSTDEAFTLHRQFEAQVDRSPDALALSYEGHSWTFRELDEYANHVAKTLIDHGVGPEKRVGFVSRSRARTLDGHHRHPQGRRRVCAAGSRLPARSSAGHCG
ncbi:MAG: AMP-binding protein, partial [Verrucomicrobiales bacterium]